MVAPMMYNTVRVGRGERLLLEVKKEKKTPDISKQKPAWQKEQKDKEKKRKKDGDDANKAPKDARQTTPGQGCVSCDPPRSSGGWRRMWSGGMWRREEGCGGGCGAEGRRRGGGRGGCPRDALAPQCRRWAHRSVCVAAAREKWSAAPRSACVLPRLPPSSSPGLVVLLSLCVRPPAPPCPPFLFRSWLPPVSCRSVASIPPSLPPPTLLLRPPSFRSGDPPSLLLTSPSVTEGLGPVSAGAPP